MIDAYGQVLQNLRVHDSRYPSVKLLHSICTEGDEDETHNPKLLKPYKQIYTDELSLIDPAKWCDTPGSDRIVELLLDDNPRQLIIQ